MKNIKNYEDFLNEEINWKKTLSTAALGVGLALSNPSFAGDNYTKDRTWSPGDTIKTTGLKEIEDLKNQAQVIVSPNPAKDWVKVGFITNEYTGKFLSISLFSINGDLIDKKEANMCGSPKFKLEVEAIKNLLQECGFDFEKVEVEYAVYDTNVTHDAKWILGNE